MVREGGEKFGEKIEKERRFGGIGEGNFVAESQYEMRHDTEVGEIKMKFLRGECEV